MGDGAPGPAELEALREPGFDRIVYGAIGALMARSAPAAQLRLARYEQLAARENAAEDRLRALLTDPGCTPEILREVRSQLLLSKGFDTSFIDEPMDWFQVQPPPELDAVGIRERVGILQGRLIADGREPRGGWPADFVPNDWAKTARILTEAQDALCARLGEVPDVEGFIELLDSSVWLTRVVISCLDFHGGLRLIGAVSSAQEKLGLRVLDHFMDYQAGIAYVGLFDIPAAAPLLERSVAAFGQCVEQGWWMYGTAMQALVASASGAPMPGDMAAVERALISGDWRNCCRALGQSTLMMLGMALELRGDSEGARHLVLAAGDLEQLVVPITDRSFIIEILFNAALAEGDFAAALRMSSLLDGMMVSPPVEKVRSRVRAALAAGRESGSQALEKGEGSGSGAEPGFTGLRSRWIMLAHSVVRGNRGETWGALADFDAFVGQTSAISMRQSAIRLLHDRTGGLPADTLSPRMLEVAVLAAEGLSNQQISEMLFISQRTVEDYLSQVFRRLGIRGRAELASAELPLELRDQDRNVSTLRLPLRQGQVGVLIAAGASNSEIAEVLDISMKTLDTHIAALKKRIGASSRTEVAAVFAG